VPFLKLKKKKKKLLSEVNSTKYKKDKKKKKKSFDIVSSSSYDIYAKYQTSTIKSYKPKTKTLEILGNYL
jgi:hypothetical protein